MLTEIFLSFVVTSGIGAILVVCRLLYKSKCKNFELCCLKIERDAEEENNADLIIDISRRLSNTNIKDEKPEKFVRFENIYKTDLPKRKVQESVASATSALEEGLGSTSIS
jgi:hypothetical protein